MNEVSELIGALDLDLLRFYKFLGIKRPQTFFTFFFSRNCFPDLSVKNTFSSSRKRNL